MRTLRLLFVAIFTLVCTSCGTSFSEKVSIESCDNVELIGFTGLKATFGFRNESARNITLQAVTITLKESGKAVGSIELKEEVKIPRRTALFETPTLWRLYDVNLIAALSASKRIAAGNTDSFKVDVVAEVKTGLFKRTFEFNNLSLSELKASMK